MKKKETNSNNHVNTYKRLVYLLLCIDIYILSFFIFARPCENLNRAPIEPDDLQVYAERVSMPAYPSYTRLCISENPKINIIAYYTYWPIHRFLSERGFFGFTFNPQSES